MNTRMVDEYLKRLKRHEQFWHDFLEKKGEEPSNYIKSEMAALKWAIRYIEDTVLIAAVHQTKYFNEENNGQI